jgi:septum formation inhibitor-activating ATPase MinD
MLGLGREKIRGSAEDLHVPFLGSIPMDPKIAAAGDSGRSILVPGSDSPMARAMDEIIIRIAGPGTSDPSPGEEAHLKTSGVEQAGFQI